MQQIRDLFYLAQVDGQYPGHCPFLATGISTEGADTYMFERENRETGETENISVAHYFQVTKGVRLRFPKLQCVEVCTCRHMLCCAALCRWNSAAGALGWGSPRGSIVRACLGFG